MGVSSCGPFKIKGNSIVLTTPNLCGGVSHSKDAPNDWKEIPLEEELSKTYPAVKIRNDCVAAVVAERLLGAGKGENNMIYVTWSTGVGTGYYATGFDVLTGEEKTILLAGKNGNASHGGHITLTDEDVKCRCGNVGDFEAMTSGWSIAKKFGGTTKEAFDAYRSGDRKAKEMINKTARIFARGLVSLNMVLDTKVIVIGGSVFLNNQDILMPLIREEFYKSFPALSEGVEIRPSTLGQHVGDLAALSIVAPEEWVKAFKENEPWKHAPETVII